MGCNPSKQGKDILNISQEKVQKVKEVLTSGNERVQNSINDTMNDIHKMDFKKASEDIQEVGNGIHKGLSDGLDELLSGHEKEVNNKNRVEEENKSSVTPVPNLTSSTELLDEEMSEGNSNSPINTNEMTDENENDEVKKEEADELLEELNKLNDEENGESISESEKSVIEMRNNNTVSATTSIRSKNSSKNSIKEAEQMETTAPGAE